MGRQFFLCTGPPKGYCHLPVAGGPRIRVGGVETPPTRFISIDNDLITGKQMAAREGVSEQFKAQDQMLWGAGLRWRPLPQAEAPTEATAETSG